MVDLQIILRQKTWPSYDLHLSVYSGYRVKKGLQKKQSGFLQPGEQALMTGLIERSSIIVKTAKYKNTNTLANPRIVKQ
ncbi:MAG: hypothetical protein Q4G66_04970 [bacterium]|nr:hypothetical protein [bacterium]